MYLPNRGMQLGKGAAPNQPPGAPQKRPVLTGATTGAAIGTSIFPGIGTAIGAAVGALVGLAIPKKHFSPWGFLFDDYPNRIYDNEIQIANARNAIAQIQGGTPTGKPPGPPGTKGGSIYQASMQAIVPRYVPGSEQYIASYNRVLNEKGGAYERTYAMQLQLMQDLQGQLQASQISAAVRGSIPVSGSATSPVVLQSQTQPPVPMSPSTVQLPSAYFGPSTTPTDAIPGAPAQLVRTPGIVQAGMIPDIGPYGPYVIGGLALLFVLFNAMDKKGAR